MLGKCSNYTAAIVGTTSVEAGLNDKPPVTELRPVVTAHDWLFEVNWDGVAVC